jgi:hypothetical protein
MRISISYCPTNEQLSFLLFNQLPTLCLIVQPMGSSLSYCSLFNKYTTLFLIVQSMSTSLSCCLPSNLLISSGRQNFVTLAAKLCDYLASLFHKISKLFKNKLSFKYFSLQILLEIKHRFIWGFLKIFTLSDFVTKLIFKSSKKSPRKHQQGGNLEDSYSHEKFI